ncbi:septal ring lytic transglycosylase RlpA family protein [Chitinophagaceae bacterium MMS25-I14]
MRQLLVTALLIFAGLQVGAQNPVTKLVKGIASFYHDKFEGRRTATGEIFDNGKFTAASNKLQLGSYVKVTNTANGRIVYVRINDRMAPTNKRVIDLASIAADQLNFSNSGTAKVKVEIVPEQEGKKGILAQKEIFATPKNEL